MSLIRVFVLPPNGRSAPDGFATGYLFNQSHPVTLAQVDWFRDDGLPCDYEHETEFRAWIETKTYVKAAKAFGSGILVLGPRYSFTINYEAP
jgi:hypothetical protein